MFRAFLLLFMLMLYADQPVAALERSTPEAQGISSRAILGFVDAAEDSIDALHSFMLLRGGKVVAEGWWYPYNPDSPHRLYSLSKSFTSTAVGLAVEEGLMSLDDLVLDHFPEEAPAEPDENLAAMRVRDLLRMNTGHLKEQADAFWSTERDTWAESFLAVPVGLKPGTHFVYNTGATYMAGLMVQRLTGGTLIDYLTPRLFAPLGIEGATWQSDDEGYNVGGWGLKIRTEDIARFGQLLLQRGMWDGRQLLPEWWVAEATALQTANGSDPDSDWDQGYGYQFWRCRHNAYRGDGAFGQYCIVMPDQDAVVAITAGVSDMQQVLDLVWDHLLPAMEHEALPPADNGPLAERLRGLSLAPQEGLSTSALAGKHSGRRFLFASNERNLRAVTFAFGGGGNADDRRGRVWRRAPDPHRPRGLGGGQHLIRKRPFSTGRRQRRMECGRHLQRETLLLRDALPPPADFPLRRRSAVLQHGVQCQLWRDEVGRADCHGTDGRGS